ncbi:hypothetical protein [Aurantimonas sp. Leaf443]|uniref:hypothetical protein n=1 Tax=Aurantimonas sp. Leaf443 TaxID=1736378 RepID=UPI0012E33110|nr:hypothetical protein [Aurantimonas sp. Leaf443]
MKPHVAFKSEFFAAVAACDLVRQPWQISTNHLRRLYAFGMSFPASQFVDAILCGRQRTRMIGFDFPQAVADRPVDFLLAVREGSQRGRHHEAHLMRISSLDDIWEIGTRRCPASFGNNFGCETPCLQGFPAISKGRNGAARED